MKSAACCARIADSRSSNHNDRGDSAENRPFWKTLSAFLLTSKHRPPDSCSGALPILEAARTFDSRLRTHHKSRSDWVLWNKQSVTGNDIQTVALGHRLRPVISSKMIPADGLKRPAPAASHQRGDFSGSDRGANFSSSDSINEVGRPIIVAILVSHV